jgi:hypothetical protein
MIMNALEGRLLTEVINLRLSKCKIILLDLMSKYVKKHKDKDM